MRYVVEANVVSGGQLTTVGISITGTPPGGLFVGSGNIAYVAVVWAAAIERDANLVYRCGRRLLGSR